MTRIQMAGPLLIIRVPDNPIKSFSDGEEC